MRILSLCAPTPPWMCTRSMICGPWSNTSEEILFPIVASCCGCRELFAAPATRSRCKVRLKWHQRYCNTTQRYLWWTRNPAAQRGAAGVLWTMWPRSWAKGLALLHRPPLRGTDAQESGWAALSCLWGRACLGVLFPWPTHDNARFHRVSYGWCSSLKTHSSKGRNELAPPDSQFILIFYRPRFR